MAYATSVVVGHRCPGCSRSRRRDRAGRCRLARTALDERVLIRPRPGRFYSVDALNPDVVLLRGPLVRWTSPAIAAGGMTAPAGPAWRRLALGGRGACGSRWRTRASMADRGHVEVAGSRSPRRRLGCDEFDLGAASVLASWVPTLSVPSDANAGGDHGTSRPQGTRRRQPRDGAGSGVQRGLVLHRLLDWGASRVVGIDIRPENFAVPSSSATTLVSTTSGCHSRSATSSTLARSAASTSCCA